MNRNIEQLFRFIGSDDVEKINEFLASCKDRNYEIVDLLDNSYLNIEDATVLKHYSGYNYKNINNAIRNTWNYEENGRLDKERFLMDANAIKSLIEEHNTSLGSFKTFRGVNLSYFKDYGIESLERLNELKDYYLLDKGFISTSIENDTSFFNREDTLLDNNIEITYNIPEEFSDGVYLGNISYSPKQKEYLINSYNLGRVNSVRVDDDYAYIDVTMIPKHVYDKFYKKTESEVNGKSK